MKKPRAVLSNLPIEQLDEVIGWLVGENATYEIVRDRLAARFGVRLSMQQIAAWWRKYCEPVVSRRDEVIRSIVREHWAKRIMKGRR